MIDSFPRPGPGSYARSSPKVQASPSAPAGVTRARAPYLADIETERAQDLRSGPGDVEAKGGRITAARSA